MKAFRCSGCLRLIPARATKKLVAAGITHRVCREGKCCQTVIVLHAVAHQAIDAERASALRITTGSAPAPAAGPTTAAGAPAEPRTLSLVAPTGRTGQRGSPWTQARNTLSQAVECPASHPSALSIRPSKCPCCNGHGVALRCAACDGQGVVYVRSRREAVQAHQPRTLRCAVCLGHGYVPVTPTLALRLGFAHG